MTLLFSTLMNKASLGMFYNVSYIPGLFSVPYIRPQGYQFLLHYLLGPCPSPNFLEATFCAASLNRPGAFSRLKRILQSRYITGLQVCFCWNCRKLIDYYLYLKNYIWIAGMAEGVIVGDMKWVYLSYFSRKKPLWQPTNVLAHKILEII